jgi:hypothetical protein
MARYSVDGAAAGNGADDCRRGNLHSSASRDSRGPDGYIARKLRAKEMKTGFMWQQSSKPGSMRWTCTAPATNA